MLCQKYTGTWIDTKSTKLRRAHTLSDSNQNNAVRKSTPNVPLLTGFHVALETTQAYRRENSTQFARFNQVFMNPKKTADLKKYF